MVSFTPTKEHDRGPPERDQKIDFDELDKELAASIEAKLETWFAGKKIKRSGEWFKIGSKGSLSVNANEGHWHSFEEGEQGPGLLSLYAWRYNLTLDDAASDLTSKVSPVRKSKEPVGKKAPNAATWKHATMPPDSFPDSHFDNGKADHVYKYRDRQGNPIGVVLRWDAGWDRDDKDIRPVSWVQESGKSEPTWKWCAFAEPRPLYRGERISQEPNKPILIVEGEQCVDVAEKILPDWIIVTWPGGAAAHQKCDWQGFEGRHVAIWPDNDKAGIEAAQAIRKAIPQAEVIDVSEFGEKEDIADLIRAGELDRIKELLPNEDSIFVDLSDILDGDLQPELPTISPSLSGECLLYAGRINEIHGEPSVGKTNITLALIKVEIESGNDVLFIDPEDNPIGIIKRAIAFGISKKAIREHLKYVHDPSPDDIKKVLAWSIRHHPAIVSFDGLAELISLCGYKEDDAVSILAFFREYVRPFTHSGAAILLSDHVVKSTENRGTWSRGSGAKMGRYDGVSYMVSLAKPYSPKHAGAVKFTIAKDRNGGVGSKGEDVFMAYIEPKDGFTQIEIRRIRKEDRLPMDEIRQIINLVEEWERRGQYPNKGTITKNEYEPKIGEKRARELVNLAIENGYLISFKESGKHYDSFKIGEKLD